MVRPRHARRLAAAVIAVVSSLVGLTAHAQQILLLDFWSPHCGPCMQMRPIVQSFEQAGYPIRQIDTTRDGQLSSQYNVSQIPCFVMLVNGREMERHVGPIDTPNLQQMFERAKDEVRRQYGVRNQSPVQQPTTQSAQPATELASENGATFRNEPPANRNVLPTERAVCDVNPASGSVPASAYASLVSASVRLYVEDAKGRSCGSGTIIDTRSGEALIITCAHLFKDSNSKGRIAVDMFEAAGEGVRVVGHATGQLVPNSCDFERDIALVNIHISGRVNVVPVAPQRTTLDRGDRVVGIGCSNGNDATIMESRITSLDRYQGPPNIEATGAPAIGRSGGGLFNLRGELVGICNNADPEGNEGIYAGLESIHAELDRAGLKEIYMKPAAAGPPVQLAAAQSSATGPSVVRGQEQPITPIPNESAASAGGNLASALPTNAAAPRDFSPTEHAALVEIMSRAATSEVVCIIRPKDAGGQSEVIQLDSVSPEFVRALKEHAASGAKTR
jgi:thiol-disulfide isomerase/thioredoxin